MGISKYISSQFKRPRGLGGTISTLIMNVLNIKQYDEVRKSMIINRNDKILDIGFGNCNVLKSLMNREECSLWGIDMSEDMVTKGKKKYPKLNLTKEDIVNVNCEDNFFDSIYTINTIYFWNDVNKGLRNVNRILKKNGVFLNIFYCKEWLENISYTQYGYNKYSIDELKELTIQSGFTRVEVKEISKNKAYCIIGTK